MKILAVDDEMLQLAKLEDAIYEAVPDAMVYSTRRPSDALRMIEEMDFDVAFLDVQMRGTTGVEIAKKMKAKMPRLNIIFVTAFTEYKSEAMDLRASGYVNKPVNADKIRAELKDLRYPVSNMKRRPVTEQNAVQGQNAVQPTAGQYGMQGQSAAPAVSETSEKYGTQSQSATQAVSGQPVIQSAPSQSATNKITVISVKNTTQPDSASAPVKAAAQNINTEKHIIFQCFGNFDAFDRAHKPVRFNRSRAKEMLAYLVFRRGSRCTNREIAAVLYENQEYDARVQDSFRHVAASMMKALKEIGAEDVILRDSAGCSVDVTKVDCDYYRFLGADEAAKKVYSGDFMSQYSWAEYVNAYLDRQI